MFCTRHAMDMPGSDYQLMKILRLEPSMKHIMLYQ
jgi:hypothetical protein